MAFAKKFSEVWSNLYQTKKIDFYKLKSISKALRDELFYENRLRENYIESQRLGRQKTMRNKTFMDLDVFNDHLSFFIRKRKRVLELIKDKKCLEDYALVNVAEEYKDLSGDIQDQLGTLITQVNTLSDAGRRTSIMIENEIDGIAVTQRRKSEFQSLNSEGKKGQWGVEKIQERETMDNCGIPQNKKLFASRIKDTAIIEIEFAEEFFEMFSVN